MGLTGGAGAGLRIFVLILLIVVLFLGGVIWFDYLGLINAREQLSFIFGLINKEKVVTIDDKDDVFLLEKERYSKMKESLDIREEELNKREQELEKLSVEIKQKVEMLDEMEIALAEREKSFNVRTRLYENKIENLEQSSKYLVGMPPLKAKDILLEMNDQDVIDIMRVTERIAQETGEGSLVSYWLSLMPAERSAAIQRKMALKPVEPGTEAPN